MKKNFTLANIVIIFLLGACASLLAVNFLKAQPQQELNTAEVKEASVSGFAAREDDDPPMVKDIPANADKYVLQNVSAVKLDPNLNFAGEAVPLHDLEVRERVDREMLVNTYWHSSTIMILKLANKYFPEIEAKLAEEGIPDDFKYVALAESGLRDLVSPAGASGIWQIMKGTAQDYGLEVNNNVDERYNYPLATEAACKYFKEAYGRFGNWTLVAASYNMGMGGVSNRLKEQKVDNYYDLYLNSETARYVFRILAFKEIYENQEKYGFYLDNEDMYFIPAYKTVTVKTGISDLTDWAIEQGTTYKMLKYLNPWLRQDDLINTTGKTYSIKVPV